jgi:Pyridoxamine 5'-phosphate oxidase
MAKEFSRIDESVCEFIGSQAVFFVATAPSEGGRVNLSPKGYRDMFAVLDDHTVAYLDLFGSGVETIAHLRDNGRITVMFCSFTRKSRILRLLALDTRSARMMPNLQVSERISGICIRAYAPPS